MIKIFTGFSDFVSFMQQHPWAVENNTYAQQIRNLTNEMQNSCPCKRGQFLPQIEANYLALEHNLTSLEQASMKQALGATQVQLNMNGQTFLTF